MSTSERGVKGDRSEEGEWVESDDRSEEGEWVESDDRQEKRTVLVRSE